MKLSTCHYCNKIFSRSRNTKQFCSLECKNKFNYSKRNGQEVPVEVYNRLRQNENSGAKERDTNSYLERIKFLEEELAKSREVIVPKKNLEQAPKVDIPTEANKVRKQKKSESKILFLAKKERIISQLLSEEIDMVTKDELEALGYPCGFFDGWTDAGEELVQYRIELVSSDSYRITKTSVI